MHHRDVSYSFKDAGKYLQILRGLVSSAGYRVHTELDKVCQNILYVIDRQILKLIENRRPIMQLMYDTVK